MTRPLTPFRRRVGARAYTLAVEPVAGSGDTPGEALAFVRALLGELGGDAAA